MIRTVRIRVAAAILVPIAIPLPLAAQQPVQGKPDTPAINEPPEKAAAQEADQLRAARTMFGRAMATKDARQRQARFERAVAAVSRMIAASPKDADVLLDLLDLEARAHLVLHDHAKARRSVKRQHEVARHRLDPSTPDAWATERVRGLRDQGMLDLAILHVSELLKNQPKVPATGQLELLIGDILVQKAYPNRPIDAALAQYVRIAEEYRSVSKEISEDATLRRAVALYRSGRKKDAVTIFTELEKSDIFWIAEAAEHYQAFSRGSWKPPLEP